MPRFNYHCTKCQNEFEALVVSDKERVHCPNCMSGKTIKVFTPTDSEPQFRGDGFHKTDYVDKGR